MDDFQVGLKEIVQHVDDEKENLIAVKKGSMFKKVGDSESVTIFDHEMEHIKDAHLVHNHPPIVCGGKGQSRSAVWLSLEDAQLMIREGVKSITSVTKYKGKVVATVLKRTRKSTLKSIPYSDGRKMCMTFEQFWSMSNDEIIEHTNSAFRSFADKYGFKYRQYVVRGKKNEIVSRDNGDS